MRLVRICMTQSLSNVGRVCGTYRGQVRATRYARSFATPCREIGSLKTKLKPPCVPELEIRASDGKIRLRNRLIVQVTGYTGGAKSWLDAEICPKRVADARSGKVHTWQIRSKPPPEIVPKRGTMGYRGMWQCR